VERCQEHASCHLRVAVWAEHDWAVLHWLLSFEFTCSLHIVDTHIASQLIQMPKDIRVAPPCTTSGTSKSATNAHAVVRRSFGSLSPLMHASRRHKWSVSFLRSRHPRFQSTGPLDPIPRPGIALELPFLPRRTWSQNSMINILAKSMVRMTLYHKVGVKVGHVREQYLTS